MLVANIEIPLGAVCSKISLCFRLTEISAVAGVLKIYISILTSLLTLFRQGGFWRPYQTLKLNNFKAVSAMTTKFSDFS